MMTEANQTKQAKQKPRVGTVISAGGEKTIQVEVQNLVKHPTYGKYVRRRTKLSVHDPENAAGVGDTVEIVSCRRLSKNKSHRLTRVVRTAALSDNAGR